MKNSTLRILRTLTLALCLPAASLAAAAHTGTPRATAPAPASVQGPVAPTDTVTYAATRAAAGNEAPEPASMALLGLGVLGLIACRLKV